MTLREALPYGETGIFKSKKLEVKVMETHDPYKGGLRWPGRHKNVVEWWVLADGTAVGWNENTSVGWSFPVIRFPKS